MDPNDPVGSSSPVPAIASREMSEKPTLGELLAHPSVIAGMRLAYVESDVGGTRPTEQGGFLVQDSQTGFVSVIRLPSSARDSLSYPHCPSGLYQNQEIVGSFHTHPNTEKEWQQEPSPQDIRLSKEYPETMGSHQFVISHERIYHIDNDGLVIDLGRTDKLLALETEEPNP